jgi:hypothetical protein
MWAWYMFLWIQAVLLNQHTLITHGYNVITQNRIHSHCHLHSALHQTDNHCFLLVFFYTTSKIITNHQHHIGHSLFVPALHGTQQLITIFATTCPWSLSWAKQIQSTPSLIISFRSVITLSYYPSHLQSSLANFSQNTCINVSSLTYMTSSSNTSCYQYREH